MNNLEKMEEMLKDNPELKQKITEEAKQLAESKEAGDAKEAIAKAIKAVLDNDLTGEELNAMMEKSGKMDLDDLDQVAGGNIIDDATRELTNLTNSIITKVIQKQEKDNARANNTAALKNAAKENCIEKKENGNREGIPISYIR